ncbi:sulfite exporter TauE/SafE family protein, partial [Desulfovibrio sp. OttesenSCG-928-I05]|nr:sulfite exporter TauE/SafE family protein [Desulfovibrio sp. OttesenSCG-928-I05]
PEVERQDPLGAALGMHGVFTDAATGQTLEWKTHRTGLGLILFCGIGIVAGMFGLGAGWANVPVLNLVMGVPFKVAVGTSTFVLSLTDTSAAWVYIHRGCVIPLMAIPAVLGLMAGARVGVRFMVKTKPASIRTIVIIMLVAAGVRSLYSGFSQIL